VHATAATSAATSADSTVTMVHLDLDCFYAQVEMLRVGAARDAPFVVSQWGNLIAVNYPARAAGIGRFDSVTTARQKCPTVRWEHVATYAPGVDSYAYHPEAFVKKATHKVSLEPYRIASRLIFEVLTSFDGVSVEKGGIDEAFLDVTNAAAALLQKKRAEQHDHGNGGEAELAAALATEAAAVTAFLDESSERMQDAESLAAAPIETDGPPVRSLFYCACLVVADIRRALRERTGYEASAGIGKNRSLAKIISATHKPNRQTLLLPGASKTFLYKLPFTKLRGFGGKLGSTMAKELVAETCGELWNVAVERFAPFVGGDMAEAREIAARIRGVGNDTGLTERNAPKSLLAQKAFYPATNDDQKMFGWLTVLAKELVQRMVIVFTDFGVRPFNFNIKVGSHGLSSTDVLNKSQELPWPPDGDQLAHAALAVVKHALANHEAKGLKVDCFLLGATVLKPDPATTVVDGRFVVRQRQRALTSWLSAAPGSGGKLAGVKREPTASGDATEERAARAKPRPEVITLSESSSEASLADDGAAHEAARSPSADDASVEVVDVSDDEDDGDGEPDVIAASQPL